MYIEKKHGTDKHLGILDSQEKNLLPNNNINCKKNKRFLAVLLLALLLFAMTATGCSTSNFRSFLSENGVADAAESSEGKYAYEKLDTNTKLVYDEIVYAIQNRKKDVRIATSDIGTMELAYQAVRYDHCEFFWLNKFSYVTYTKNKKITAIDITPTYSMTPEEQKKMQAKIDKEADRMLKNVPKNGTDYDKALYVYETLVTDVDYEEYSKNNQNIISAFINHKTICQGYAYATQYLLEKLGIQCTTVEGTADGENHAWNLVMLDGSYYYIDTTWGNSQYIYLRSGSDTEDEPKKKYVDYDYFAATSETIFQTHKADTRIALPDCNATKDNYYIHEGQYFSTWDPTAIGHAIAKAYNNKASQVQIKFATTDLYEQAQQYFIEDAHLTTYCPGIKRVRFMDNADNSVLFLLFPDN